MTDLRLAVGTDATSAGVERVIDALDATRVVVRVGDKLDPLAAVAASALVSMIGRIHAHVEVDGDAACAPNPWNIKAVSDVLMAIASHRPIETRDATSDLVVSFGAGVADICVGGDDWTARIGDAPVVARAGTSGIGLHAAAAFAAAEVFKRLLVPIGFVAVPAQFEWDLLTYRFGHSDPPTATPSSPELLFAGAGSVNSSAAAILMNSARGHAAIVDPDAFDSARNPYRYPAAVGETVGPKASWIADMLRSAGWKAEPYEVTIGEWVAAQAQPGFAGIVVSSVDNVAGRADVADILAHTTLSAGVGGLALHVQREHAYDEYACPNCEFVDLGAPITQVQVIADMTGLEVARAAELIEGALLTEADLQIVANTGRADSVADLLGHRIADLVGRLYAEATIPIPGSNPIQVSAPFVSWIAGAIAAAEVTKAANGFQLLDRRLDLEMSGVPTGATSRRLRDASGRCTCASPWRRRAAGRMYAN